METLFLESLSLNAKAPSEIKLWSVGTVGTAKGLIRCTQRTCKAIATQWASLNRDIGFDYGHAEFLDVPEEEKIAAGWGRVEVRSDGVYVTSIQWTEQARKKIEAKEFRYVSPAITVDKKTGEVLGLHNVALTNRPATLGAAPLVLSAHLKGMDQFLKTKETTLVGRLLAQTSMLASVAQECADGTHEQLRDVGAKLAGFLSEQIAVVRLSFPEIEPDKADAEAAETLSFVEKVTGKKGADARAEILVLAQRSRLLTESRVQDEKKALIAHMQKSIADGGTQQIAPGMGELFEAMSMADLRKFQEVAPVVGPRQVVEMKLKSPTAEPPPDLDGDSEPSIEFGLKILGRGK